MYNFLHVYDMAVTNTTTFESGVTVTNIIWSIFF